MRAHYNQTFSPFNIIAMQATASVPTTSTQNTATETRDIYREVTEKLVSLIEQGVTPWRRSWSQYGPARNYATGHIYSGINFILMNCTPFAIPYFMSFKQIKERGGQIRKGAKGQMVIYFNVYFKDGAEQTLSKEEASFRAGHGEDIQVLKFIKYYTVFNVADIEGIEFEFPEMHLQPHEKIECCESIIDKMPQRPVFKQVNPDQPFYAPAQDFVNMPAIEQFETPEHYYVTLFHELIHATGHASRIGRDGIVNPHKFGSEPYSLEELVAEMGASFLCAQAQINYDGLTENNAAYLAGWLKVLKADSKFIFKAAAEAQKAADFILNRRELKLNPKDN